MKVSGIIITTITEQLTVDVEDGLSTEEMADQFMKAAIVSDLRVTYGKTSQFHIVGLVSRTPQESET